MKFIDDEELSPLSEGTLEEDLDYWINDFLENKRLKKVTAKTISSYEDALQTFKDFAKKHPDNTMENIGAKFINNYLIDYQKELALTKPFATEKYDSIIAQANSKKLGKNNAGFEIHEDFERTLNHRLTVVKMLLKHIDTNSSDDTDYQAMFHNIAIIKIKEVFQDMLTFDEVDTIIDFMRSWIYTYKNFKKNHSIETAYRDSFLLLLYALTGARSEEVVKIKLRDIVDFKHRNKEYCTIKISEAKGGKIREVAIQKDVVSEHLTFLRKNLPNEEYYISSSFAKNEYVMGHAHPDSVRRFTNFILKELGINKSGNHVFRRTYATKRVLQDEKDLAVVAKEIGNTVGVLEKYYFKHSAIADIIK